VLERWAAGREALPPPVVAVLRAVANGAPPGDLDALVSRIRAANRTEERAPRIEFVPDVWTFPVKTETLPPATHTNVWLPGGRRFVVIDPGSAAAAERAALDRVVDRRIAEGATPEAVVLTHHHQDHVSGAAPLARRLGVPVAAHPEVLRRVVDRLPAIPTRAIAADETIDLDGIRLRAVLTEGHAPGHLAFHVPDRDALISGDLVSALSTMLIDPDGGDMDAYLDSLRRAEELQPRLVLPAHGPPVPARALGRVRAHREERETRIVRALDEGCRALADLARAAYADTPGVVAFLAERQTLAHLIRLERAGKAERVGDRWRARSRN
jgi:glyoxylase-like metal-dependent hydrolase (beta-lactamase superfamily II)